MRRSKLMSGMLAALIAGPLLAATPAAGQKAVLVTGSSSGIGRAITRRLAADGWFVYAGVRKDADMPSLAAMKNVQPVKLDVTDARQIAAAVQLVQQGGGLYGLVNDAGIGSLAPIIAPHKDELDLTLAVNAVAPYRMAQAFGPLIIRQKGRIITVGSTGGIVSNAISGAYSMSKFAVEAFTDALAEELAPQGVAVSVIEPGTYRSNISKNAQARGEGADGLDPSKEGDPDDVARVVEHALGDAHPKRRYMPVPNEKEAQWALGSAFARLVQINEGQPYKYDRATLIRMLDDALAHKPVVQPF